MLGENALRQSATPISSAMAARRWCAIWRSAGESMASLSRAAFQQQVAGGQHARGPTGRNDRRGTQLGDHERAADATRAREVFALDATGRQPAAAPPQSVRNGAPGDA